MSNPDQHPTDTEPDTAAVRAAAKPTPVRYVFSCGSGPCKLSYEFDSDLHKQRKLPAPVEPKPDQD